jgi:flagellar biosynthesis/type III secretory pathway chaperone
VSEFAQPTAALLRALDDECEIYDVLLKLAQREERALVMGDVLTLTNLAEEKEHLLEVFAALETERATAITTVAIATGGDTAGETLDELIGRLPGEAVVSLTQAEAELHRRAGELRAANARNAELLRKRVDVVERWIQHLRASLRDALSYGVEDVPESRDGWHRIDRIA